VLALSGLSLGRDERRKDVAVQVGLVLHNASDWPIKYHVEDMEVVIGDRAISKPNFTNMGGFISKGCNTMFLYPAFPQSVVNPSIEGRITYTIAYGHPDFGPGP
jgi:hypothetical protein